MGTAALTESQSERQTAGIQSEEKGEMGTKSEGCGIFCVCVCVHGEEGADEKRHHNMVKERWWEAGALSETYALLRLLSHPQSLTKSPPSSNFAV